jgi:hypothetical protein
MIIFGTSAYLYRLAVLMLTCHRCGTPAAHTVTKHVTKFTLFFVPLFPLSTTYATQCTFCAMEQGVPMEWAEQVQAHAAALPGGETYGYAQQSYWSSGA